MNNNKLVVCIVGVILILGGLLIIFLLPKNSNKEIYYDAVKKSLKFDFLEKISNKEDADYLKNNIIHIEAEANSDNSVNGPERTTYNYYLTKEKQLIGIRDEINDLDSTYYLDNNKMYIEMNNILDNIYYYDVITSNSNNKTEKDEDADKLINLVKDNFLSVIKNSEVEIYDTERFINKIEYKVKKYSYDFSGQDLYNFLEKMVKDIKNDKSLYDKLEKTIKSYDTNSFNGSFDDLLDKYLSYVSQIKDTKKVITYSVYMMDDNVITSELTIYVTVQGITVPVMITFNRLNNFYQITMSSMGMRAFEFSIDLNEKTISMSDNKGVILSGAFEGDEYIIKSGEDQEKQFNIHIKFNKEEKTATGEVEIQNEDGSVTKGNITLKMETVNEFPNYDISNSKPIEEATEKDLQILNELFSTGKEYLNSNGLGTLMA